MSNHSRRNFIKSLGLGTATLALGNQVFGGTGSGFSAKSYRNIMGANERINMGIIGLNGRGNSICGTIVPLKNAQIVSICDVDQRTFSKVASTIQKAGQEHVPKVEKDLRRVLEDKSVDAIYTATPDHWHAPLTIMACQAGKHVYVEKPLSHNPKEGEMAIAAARKYNRVVQMGAQRRSAPILTAGIKQLHEGIIGRVYTAKAWYTNVRKPTYLKPGQIPDWLDYDLWQGPAPRMAYQDGLIHYNWHWFWHWGTGEALNNGTHEVDVARWGLGAEFPIRVSSIGGRYHYQDDWETPDTQTVMVEYPGKVSLQWENRSCNGRKVEGLERGLIFYGEKGSMDTGDDGYRIYDLEGKLIKEAKQASKVDPMAGRNTASPNLGMDSYHMVDFLDAIKDNRKPNCDVEIGHKSTIAMQLANISWRVGKDLKINPENGHIIDNPEAQKLWSRTYEKGWEPVV